MATIAGIGDQKSATGYGAKPRLTHQAQYILIGQYVPQHSFVGIASNPERSKAVVDYVGIQYRLSDISLEN